ncbi:MAG: hypothetical protein ACRD13_12985 [Terriglobales bacterium]
MIGSRESNLIRACGLWRGRSKTGTEYLSGKLTVAAVEALAGARVGDRLMIFKNHGRREGRNDPEYSLAIAPADAANGNSGAKASYSAAVHPPGSPRDARNGAGDATAPPRPAAPPRAPRLEITDDDIPF